VEGTLLGPSPQPLFDGPVLRDVAVAPRIRERQSSRPSGDQAMGLRPCLPLRVARPPADVRRPLIYLLNLAARRRQRGTRARRKQHFVSLVTYRGVAAQETPNPRELRGHGLLGCGPHIDRNSRLCEVQIYCVDQ